MLTEISVTINRKCKYIFFYKSLQTQTAVFCFVSAQNSHNFQKIDTKMQFFCHIKQQKSVEMLGALPPNPRLLEKNPFTAACF